MSTETTVRDVVAVQFQDRKNHAQYIGREYTYYSSIPLEIGDIVAVPTKRGTGKAKVARINLTTDELIPGIDYKTIDSKVGTPENPALSDKDRAILESWSKFDGPDVSTEKLLALVEDETGYDAGDITAALYLKHQHTNENKEA